jgi:hypothetical protein
MVTLDQLRVERERSARDTRGGEDQDTEDGELDTTDVFQNLPCGDLGLDLLVYPVAEDRGEHCVHDDIHDVELFDTEHVVSIKPFSLIEYGPLTKAMTAPKALTSGSTFSSLAKVDWI